MAVTAGTRLGPYEIIARLGAGGMGEVYQARDSRLGRTVAVKVLAPKLTADPVARQRLEREARTISTLSHPHICPLFDIGHQDGTDFLVMEYLEGESLAARLKRDNLAPDDALRYGMQIVDALAAAHRAGIVHRDLKPGNVMLTKAGAMLLDFGLARTRDDALANGGTDTTRSAPLTTDGAIVGTLRYMAPEQLAGRAADLRTDVFAVGLLFCELFQSAPVDAPPGTFEPQKRLGLAAHVPANIRWIVERCLHEDPDSRWQHAGDVLIALDAANGGAGPEPGPSHTLANRYALAALATVALAAALTGAAVARRGATSPAASRVEFALPMEGELLERPAVSPDGRAVAFVASREGTRDVRVRSLETGRVIAVPGSEGAEFVFWSPDGHEIGYAAHGALRRSVLPNGPPRTIAAAAAATYGATWSGDVVLFSGAGGQGIFRVSAHGGTPAPLTTSDAAKRESSHRFPLFLPDGHHFFFLVRSDDDRISGLYVDDLNEPARRRVAANIDSSFAYAAGHLLFAREGTLWSQGLDADRLVVTGDPTAIAHPMFIAPAGRWTQVGASATTVAYLTGDLTYPTVLRWLSRDGRELGTVGPTAPNWNPQLSPDGHQLAVARRDDTGTRDLIWLTDLKRSVETNFTPEGGINGHPVWAPDGAHLAYASNVGGYWVLRVKGVREAEARQVLPSDHVSRWPQGWATDDALIYEEQGQGGVALWQTHLSAPGSRTLLVRGAVQGAVSPDGRWLAFASDETGQYEVYVRRYGSSGQDRWQVSAGGGVQPHWRADTRELYFLRPDGVLCAVAVGPGTQFEAGSPKVLWRAKLLDVTNSAFRHYTPAADGSRFLINAVTEHGGPLLHVVVNWRPE